MSLRAEALVGEDGSAPEDVARSLCKFSRPHEEAFRSEEPTGGGERGIDLSRPTEGCKPRLAFGAPTAR